MLISNFLATPVKALMKQRFAFAIDTTGGEITSAVLPQLRYDGRSAICGRAAGITLEQPFYPLFYGAFIYWALIRLMLVWTNEK